MSALMGFSYVLLWLIVIILTVMVVLMYRQFGLLYMGSGETVRIPGLKAGDAAPTDVQVQVDSQLQDVPWVTGTQDTARPIVLVLTYPDCTLMPDFTDGLAAFATRHARHFDVWVVDSVSRDTVALLNRPRRDHVTNAITVRGELHERFDVEISPYVYLIEPDGTIVDGALIATQGALEALVRTYYVEDLAGVPIRPI